MQDFFKVRVKRFSYLHFSRKRRFYISDTDSSVEA